MQTNKKNNIAQRPKSQALYESLSQAIPGGVNSPLRAFKSANILPLIAERGDKDMIYDVDGNGYIDYCGSWGPLIHGHSHPAICKAACDQIALGSTFGLSCEPENTIAHLIKEAVPSVEKLRFVSSGTEATMSAIRLARGVTGRDLLVKFSGHYHGHSDMLLMQAGSGLIGLNKEATSAGIPQNVIAHTVSLEYNNVQMCRNFLIDRANKDKIAAVILEPIAGNMGCVPSSLEFLLMLRDVTSEIGALLIFDEVITGFRVGLKGAQGHYGITPDLTCFGKIIGGGFPAAAFGGPSRLMDHLAPLGKVYQAGTLSGNPVAMRAGTESLKLLQQEGFYAELERKTNVITEPVKALITEKGINACLQQVGSMFTLFFGTTSVLSAKDLEQCSSETFFQYFRYLLERGVYVPQLQQECCFVSMAHTDEHLTYTRDLILAFLKT